MMHGSSGVPPLHPSPPLSHRKSASSMTHGVVQAYGGYHGGKADDDDNDDDVYETGSDTYTALKHVEAATVAMDSASIITSQMAYHATHHADATDTVHEMHLALLYLLTNPEEFSKALQLSPPRDATTLPQWNAEYDNESLLTDAESTVPPVTQSPYRNNRLPTESAAGGGTPGSAAGGTPLPFVVFADDAEVVLPQAHTASQLFGVERIEGIELEAAAGIPAISQLFLRWLGTLVNSIFLRVTPTCAVSQAFCCSLLHK
jgi:hypothetical protein